MGVSILSKAMHSILFLTFLINITLNIFNLLKSLTPILCSIFNISGFQTSELAVRSYWSKINPILSGTYFPSSISFLPHRNMRSDSCQYYSDPLRPQNSKLHEYNILFVCISVLHYFHTRQIGINLKFQSE